MSSEDAATKGGNLEDTVRRQAAELEKLASEKENLLNRVEATELKYKDALQLHLDSATKEKQRLETDLAALSGNQEARTIEFKRQLNSLRPEQEERTPRLELQEDISDQIDAALSSKDVEQITEAVSRFRDQLVHQEAQIKKLKFELDMECGHVNILRAENQKLRQMTVDLVSHLWFGKHNLSYQRLKFVISQQASAEQEEEYIANKLMKRIHSLKKEKGELLMKVEQEEEMITNTLQKKLSQLQKEKVDMEVALEQEQEFIVNRLQKQLESLRQQQSASASTPRKMSHPSHSPSTSMMDFPVSPGVTEVLRAEVNSLKTRIHDMEIDYEEGAKTCGDLYSKLREEVIQLRQKLNISSDDIDKQYPPVLPTLVKERSRSTSNLASSERSRSGSSSFRRSPSETSVGPYDAAPYRYERRSSRSVSSTRGSIMSSTT
ncbi:hypothetical protein DFS34DRAFT_595383 [Phlyctochytrium arcticum]|nr:hypothetical protein DFS34DRAFT_595383 [Phlyctochytrium arcticum]